MSDRKCSCGCDSFRFMFKMDDDVYGNTCKNCKHTLAEHINTIRSKQAE